MQKFHEVNERRTNGDALDNESHGIPNNNRTTLLESKLRYISIIIRVILLIFCIAFIVMDAVATGSNYFGRFAVINARINTWLGVIVSEKDFILRFCSLQI